MNSGDLNKPSLFAVEQRIPGSGKQHYHFHHQQTVLSPGGKSLPHCVCSSPLRAGLAALLPLWCLMGHKAHKRKRQGGSDIRHCLDALVGMRYRVETSASVWTVGLTSIVSAEFVARNWVLASPWTLSLGQLGHISSVWFSTFLELPGIVIPEGKVSPEAMFGCLWSFPQG